MSGFNLLQPSNVAFGGFLEVSLRLEVLKAGSVKCVWLQPSNVARLAICLQESTFWDLSESTKNPLSNVRLDFDVFFLLSLKWERGQF